MSPARKAVSFIEYPATDLALLDHVPERYVPKLLGGNIQNSHVAKTYPFLHIAPLWECQHSVECRRKSGFRKAVEVVHLILHQGLQRRNNDRQHAKPLVSHQRR